MASGINIYSFFQISKKIILDRLSEKEFVISEYWHINFRYLKKEFQISEITISDI